MFYGSPQLLIPLAYLFAQKHVHTGGILGCASWARCASRWNCGHSDGVLPAAGAAVLLVSLQWCTCPLELLAVLVQLPNAGRVEHSPSTLHA